MDIKLCMGSSCFARGNAENLSFLEKYIEENNLSIDVDLCGCRCENQCNLGPNITINGITYHHMTLERLQQILTEEKGNH